MLDSKLRMMNMKKMNEDNIKSQSDLNSLSKLKHRTSFMLPKDFN